MAKDGVSIKQIVRQTGHSRKTVRQVIRGGRADVFRSRMNSLEPYLLLLDSHWTAGCSNGAELWRRLKADGFGGSPRVVSEWATRRRRTECVTEGQLLLTALLWRRRRGCSAPVSAELFSMPPGIAWARYDCNIAQ
jgi:transposase